MVQSLQPTHLSSSTSFAPAALIVIAPTGQAVIHHPSAHCVHVYGAYEVCPSKGDTRMTDFAGWKAPVCMYEQASSHRRQPVHFSGWMRRTCVVVASMVTASFVRVSWMRRARGGR